MLDQTGELGPPAAGGRGGKRGARGGGPPGFPRPHFCGTGGGEWNNGAHAGAHLWISQPPPFGGGVGSIYVNLIDTAGAFHTLTTAGGVVTTNGFQHVALTYDKTSGTVGLYYNGGLVATQSLGTFAPQTTYGFYLGNRVSEVPFTLFRGSMDEASLYSRALSGAEIQAIYNADGAGKCPLGVAPSIIMQPAGQTVSAGGTAAFSVTAAGTLPLSYQWQFSGTNIAGATGTALTLSNVQSAQAGSYAVQVTNAFGSILSSNALLTVISSPACAPPPSGLVGWWRGEGVASDSADSNNGIVEGGVAFAAGEVGQAFKFNGTNADVRVPASASLNVGTGDGLTIEAWVNPADVSTERPLVEWNSGLFG